MLIKGLLALTNRRLLLYAYIPPPEPRDVVLKAGPVTAMNGPVNGRSCFLGKKSRVSDVKISNTFFRSVC